MAEDDERGGRRCGPGVSGKTTVAPTAGEEERRCHQGAEMAHPGARAGRFQLESYSWKLYSGLRKGLNSAAETLLTSGHSHVLKQRAGSTSGKLSWACIIGF